MSYQLAGPDSRCGVTASRAVIRNRPLSSQRIRNRRMAQSLNLRSSGYGIAPDRDPRLGFSLKPPKWLRKAATKVKKQVTLKRALIAGAIVGAGFIPGVAPALLATSKGLFTAGKVGTSLAIKALRGRAASGAPPPEPAPAQGGFLAAARARMLEAARARAASRAVAAVSTAPMGPTSPLEQYTLNQRAQMASGAALEAGTGVPFTELDEQAGQPVERKLVGVTPVVTAGMGGAVIPVLLGLGALMMFAGRRR